MGTPAKQLKIGTISGGGQVKPHPAKASAAASTLYNCFFANGPMSPLYTDL